MLIILEMENNVNCNCKALFLDGTQKPWYLYFTHM